MARNQINSSSRRGGRSLVLLGLAYSSLALLVPLTGCTTTQRASESSAGQIHNSGVVYALERLGEVPRRNELSARIRPLVSDYCQSIRKSCAVPSAVPFFPLRTEELIEASNHSEAFKSHARDLTKALRSARDIPEFRRTSEAIARRAGSSLAGAERKQFADAVSIAQSSAQLWAPVSLGGRGGREVDFPPLAARPIDWGEVGEADAMGCLATLEIGCVEGAILFSVANIIWQLAQD